MKRALNELLSLNLRGQVRYFRQQERRERRERRDDDDDDDDDDDGGDEDEDRGRNRDDDEDKDKVSVEETRFQLVDTDQLCPICMWTSFSHVLCFDLVAVAK